MLVDEHLTYFWYPKEDASGDEDNETFVRVPAGIGITGHVLKTCELLSVDGPVRDERYDPIIDSVMGMQSHIHVSLSNVTSEGNPAPGPCHYPFHKLPCIELICEFALMFLAVTACRLETH